MEDNGQRELSAVEETCLCMHTASKGLLLRLTRIRYLTDHKTPYAGVLDKLDHIIPEEELLIRKVICIQVSVKYFLELIECSFIFFVHVILPMNNPEYIIVKIYINNYLL
ncbi:hypothetical protein [Methanolobus chelungpuianus]|uniref:hypothetical protein n=1 Tax=Methanolobus chelungpuianus TaxID=502115 RepID=UPI0021143E7E|nr:hypothetical protein [Methanolobus chelungpuianus]